MLSGIERHFSVVSLLLVAGAGLIIMEGPLSHNYEPIVIAPKAMEKQDAPDAGKQAPVTTKLGITKTTWLTALDDTSLLHSTVLGELPLSEKSDSSAASK